MFSETGMERRHHLRAVADRGGNALDRAGAYVSDCEYPPPAGFKRQPSRAGILAGADEAAGINLQPRLLQPIGVGLGTDERKELADRPLTF